jgi:hypothetical protein
VSAPLTTILGKRIISSVVFSTGLGEALAEAGAMTSSAGMLVVSTMKLTDNIMILSISSSRRFGEGGVFF